MITRKYNKPFLWLNYLSVTWVFWHISYTPDIRGELTRVSEEENVRNHKNLFNLHFFTKPPQYTECA